MNPLLAPWPGPFGGLPPFDLVTPDVLEDALPLAIDVERAEIAAVRDNPAPPTFANTILALEASGQARRRIAALLQTWSSTRGEGRMPEVAARLAPIAAAADDEAAHDDALFARVEAVRDAAGLAPEDARLTEMIWTRMRRRGAGLPACDKDALGIINGRLAELGARFGANLVAEAQDQLLWIDNAADLDGLPAASVESAREFAAQRGRAGAWAIANTRPAIWPVLQNARVRRVREAAWRMWMERGGNPGPHDNRPIIAEIAELRGRKARLLGYPTFAHFATADRMAGTPDAALDLLTRVWEPVLRLTRRQLDALQRLADADGIELRPWDRYFYAERLRQSRFGLDAEAVKPFCTVENLLAALFDQAGRLHGLAFDPLPDAPIPHPDARAFAVRRGEEDVGVIWFDLMARPGKMRGSWQTPYRLHANFGGHRAPPLCAVHSNLEAGPDGRITMGWELVNVLFHEFGHALHMLLGHAPYPSLGSLAVPWDFIEVPALLNERWLYDPALIARHFRGPDGAPMPLAMIEAIRRGLDHDRVFSLTLDYLAMAIIDLRIHLLADGSPVDPVAVEQTTLADLQMPAAMDLVMPVPCAFHTWSDFYAAGVYSYLWADVIAADVADLFLAGDGLYDPGAAERYRTHLLASGAMRPLDDAFRALRGRDPDPAALLSRFDLAAA